MDKLSVIKVGGGVIENEVEMDEFLDRFSLIEGKKILVHGGGREANKVMEKLGIPVKMVEGRRITDAQTLDVVTMVYGGLVNKKTVSALQVRGCNAIGLTGADAAVVIAKKRPVKDVDYGFVGDVERVNKTLVAKLIELGLTPVIAPLTFDITGSLLNTNADTIASEIAMALSGLYSVSLFYCFEKSGVLLDASDEASLIPHIDRNSYSTLKQNGTIKDGMIPKIDDSFKALENGVAEVWITSAKAVYSEFGTRLTL